MNPTQEQMKVVWEWCGFEYREGWVRPWVYPLSLNHLHGNMPKINLNNLFKYAVPIAIKIIMAEQECDEELAYAILFKKWLQIGYDALALFWALDKVRNETNNNVKP